MYIADVPIAGVVPYHGWLTAGRPVDENDPASVLVVGRMSPASGAAGNAVMATWEIRGPRFGKLRLAWGTNTHVVPLEVHPNHPGLGQAAVEFVMDPFRGDSIRLVRRVGGERGEETFRGDFVAVSAELRNTAVLRAKTERGTPVELCRIQGVPVVVQVEEP